MQQLMDIARKANIPVIEDCAQAHGARRGTKMAGSWGGLAAFSFYPTKNLGALGDGGAIVSSRADLALRAKRLRQYGWSSKYVVSSTGGRNSRLDEIQAAFLRAKLPFLNGWNSRRREIATRYSQEIKQKDIRLPEVGGSEYVAHLYVIESQRRDDLAAHLKKQGIASDIHYPIPDHLQTTHYGTSIVALPQTERLASTVLSLPCFPEMTDDEIRSVIKSANEWL